MMKGPGMNIWSLFSAVLTIAVWVLLGSFIYFCADALRPSPDLHSIPADCDGIVALTGGEHRIEAGIALLRQQPDRLLLISGVSPHTGLSHILAATKSAPLPPELTRQISLGYRAATTIGNAWETAQWAEQKHLHHLVLVTAGYHMRRSLLEFHDIAPQLRFTPYWVQPSAMNTPLHPRTMLLMFSQYGKLVGAFIRLMLLHQQDHAQEGFRPASSSPSLATPA
ncbi:YdcF family protein [Bombella sp. TMW 2.2559]|uniref:YdcF family protein n=1 Tax=Bombella dulcis TaxID=2967339 RepID=A0ABT3WEI9_9PROT|nr:YdcF family protein [Bombella dulcis]MCX5616650.1 YdcF family protein [Bombella dulcis]